MNRTVQISRITVIVGVVLLSVADSRGQSRPAAEAVARSNQPAERSHLLWEIGKLDGDTSEFALGPKAALQYATEFKMDPVFGVDTSDPRKDWCYAQPGPADAWAGNRQHSFTIVFGVAAAAESGECKLRCVLLDTHPEIPPQLRISINGHTFDRALPKGAGPESIAGAIAKGRRHDLEIPFPASLLVKGDNTIVITTVAGSWLLYDWLGLETPPAMQAASVARTLFITGVAGTGLFPRAGTGEEPQENAQVGICNIGSPVTARLAVRIGDKKNNVIELGQVEHGASTRMVQVPGLAAPTTIKVELYAAGKAEPVGSQTVSWRPAKKWKIYCVSYSHHDLGYGNYPHRLRTDIRHANIERPLQFCTETDSWDEDSKFRFVIETSEPMTSYLGTHSEKDAAELARRIREGRIEVGAVHNTANTEELGTEALARLFYMSGRHTRDLLGVPAGKTVLIDDVVGLTWPLATLCGEADLPYFWHGHNGTAVCLRPAAAEPVFYWQAPDGRNKVLMRSFDYGGYAGDTIGDGSEAQIQKVIERFAANWPYDSILCQDGTDFLLVTLDNARKIKKWNEKYSYPRLICATMDMFFDDIAAQMDRSQVPTFAKDANNLWADQDANDALLLGQARRQGEAVPTAEKLATIASTLTGGGYPWLDIYQAYHRLLAYHEHTNAAMNGVGPSRAGAQHYETELVENREMIVESQGFSDRASGKALGRLADAIGTRADESVIVFNPLNWARTDLVRLAAGQFGKDAHLVDSTTGRKLPQQQLADGSVIFVAADVPSMGYKTFELRPAPSSQPESDNAETGAAAQTLENGFYRIRFDPSGGGIVSIFDKELQQELVDSSAPQKFNEYLYEYYASAGFDRAEWHRPEAAQLSQSQGPVASTMSVTARAAGVEQLRQEVTIYKDLKRIDFGMHLVKSPAGRTLDDYAKATAKGKEAVYAALPLQIPEFTIRHETPGAVVEPIRQQFAGSCTAFYAVRHFADISNERYGVTLAAVEPALIEYGRSRSCPYARGEGDYESVLTPPAKSYFYLYLMNNMFDTNVRIDQRGPVDFHWSIRSHQGDWKKGQATTFGWEIGNPLIATTSHGKRKGSLPADTYSFMSVDQPNVVCTTMKPAEANGSGLILRFSESEGVETKATVSLPFFGKIDSARETNLVEDDRPGDLTVSGDHVSFTIAPFGIKNIRVLRNSSPPETKDVNTTPVSDMEVFLSWNLDGPAEAVDHYNVYRGTSPDFRPTLLNLVARPAQSTFTDRPQLNFGGWINNRLDPDTTYYYRVAAADRWNNEGPASSAIPTTTFKSAEKNALPLRVEGLRVILVSEVAPHNYLNLLWRTNCESDVNRYEVYRGTQADFTPEESNRIGIVDADAIVKGSGDYGHTPIDRKLSEFDHQMYQDDAVQPGTTYYYCVCAVDRAGQKGPYSDKVIGRTRAGQ